MFRNQILTTMPKKTILWLEDEKQQSSMLTKVFIENGYATIVHDNAKEALQSIKKITPDLFLIDIKLNGDDGIEFFRKIKTIERFEKTPVVFLTAYNSLKMAIEAKKEGAADYITKPFDVEFLLDRINELIPAD
jgi:DNA-binding response OmpR family regulator